MSKVNGLGVLVWLGSSVKAINVVVVPKSIA